MLPPPPKNYKISSAFSYNFKLALTYTDNVINHTLSKLAPQPVGKGQHNASSNGIKQDCSWQRKKNAICNKKETTVYKNTYTFQCKKEQHKNGGKHCVLR